MIDYNICFIRRKDELLLLNRQNPAWMGAWNGVGGKLEHGETPRDSVVREVYEETSLRLETLFFKGLVTWFVDESYYGGMYLYLAELDGDYAYDTPVKTDEGILDWKAVSWIMHPKNAGVATNIPRFLPAILEEDRCYIHHCIYRNGKLTDFQSTPVAPDIENATELPHWIRS